jgi:hypothetical protein
MPSAVIASAVAVIVVVFVEGFARYYPARPTWQRLKRTRGRQAVRAMRERFEAAGERRQRWLRTILLALVILWAAGASLLDKRWWEVALDIVPYVIVYVALARTPRALKRVGARMKAYEEESGEDFDADRRDGGPPEFVL